MNFFLFSSFPSGMFALVCFGLFAQDSALENLSEIDVCGQIVLLMLLHEELACKVTKVSKFGFAENLL